PATPEYNVLLVYVYDEASPLPALDSFPTRRSSDLALRDRARQFSGRVEHGHCERYLHECIGRQGAGHRHGRYIREGIVRNVRVRDRKSTRLNSSHLGISYAVFCLKKKRWNLCLCVY